MRRCAGRWPDVPACRFCATTLQHTVVDLGMSPLCESYVTAEQLNHMEPYYPLRVYVCDRCFLVQVQEYVSPEAIFREYAYFSSYSDSWLAHVKGYVNMITARLGLTPASQVASFTEQVHETKRRLLEFLIAAKRRGKRIAGYGAPG